MVEGFIPLVRRTFPFTSHAFTFTAAVVWLLFAVRFHTEIAVFWWSVRQGYTRSHLEPGR